MDRIPQIFMDNPQYGSIVTGVDHDYVIISDIPTTQNFFCQGLKLQKSGHICPIGNKKAEVSTLHVHRK